MYGFANGAFLVEYITAIMYTHLDLYINYNTNTGPLYSRYSVAE